MAVCSVNKGVWCFYAQTRKRGSLPTIDDFAAREKEERNSNEIQSCCDIVLDVIQSKLSNLKQLSDRPLSSDECEGCFRELDQMMRWITTLEEFVPDSDLLVICLQRVQEAVTASATARARGRPNIPIAEEHIRFYLEHGFTVNKIANMFGCSQRTVERRMKEFNLSARSRYVVISDAELNAAVSQICTGNPYLGEKLVDGRLRAQGIVVQRYRLREALYSVDPEGVQLRLRKVLHRRQYYVPHPNSLWHVDGYHKLIRWKVVIHGGIDGYSRVVTYLQASTNNSAETAFNAFMEGVRSYNLPSRVRTDKGGENNLIAEYMVRERGAGRGSVIMGRSVHNQRIERLWRDLFSACISYFYFLFHTLEEGRLLNPDDVCDLTALHMTFLPKIQKHLDHFRLGWCNHRMRTERNCTPHQLWIEGMHHLVEHPNLDEDEALLYGVDWEGPVSGDADENTVQLDDLDAILTVEEKEDLQSTLNEMENRSTPHNEECWLSQYIVSRAFIQEHFVHN